VDEDERKLNISEKRLRRPYGLAESLLFRYCQKFRGAAIDHFLYLSPRTGAG
jgi:hypothetical protein